MSYKLELPGHCPICDRQSTFTADNPWLRDHLKCPDCRSIPRERALAMSLQLRFPGWRGLAIHESSPAPRGISTKLGQAPAYLATHYFPDQPLGEVVMGYRNEDLEHQTFADGTFDLVVALDVMEHVNQPDAVVREVWRTLRAGGAYLFTAPTYKQLERSVRRARYHPAGRVEDLIEPAEYHGNPVDPRGSLVTFHYGYDLAELVAGWAPFDVTVERYHAPGRGVLGEFTEVYVCQRR